MKKIILLVCLFLLLGAEIIKSTPKESNFCTIRIDQYNRIWHNLKMVTPDNLPVLLSNRIDDTLPQNDNSVYLKITELIKNNYTKNNKLSILFTAHPSSHYVIIDNLIYIKAIVEHEVNIERAAKKGFSIDSLPDRPRYRMRYGIQEWWGRDNKIIEAACERSKVVSDGLTICEEEFQFKTKDNQGYWDKKAGRDTSFYFILPIAPKVGIPVSLRDGESHIK